MGYFKDDTRSGRLRQARMTHAFGIDLPESGGRGSAVGGQIVQVHARMSLVAGVGGQGPGVGDDRSSFPLLITADSGADSSAGRVAIINTSADGDWGTLAAEQAFIPLMQRLVVWLLAPSSPCRNLSPGEPYRLALPKSDANVSITVTPPDGKAVVLKAVHDAKSDKAVCEFTPTDRAGIYQVTWTPQNAGVGGRGSGLPPCPSVASSR